MKLTPEALALFTCTIDGGEFRAVCNGTRTRIRRFRSPLVYPCGYAVHFRVELEDIDAETERAEGYLMHLEEHARSHR